MLDIGRGSISKRSVVIFTFIFMVIIFAITVLSYMSSTSRLKQELNYSNITLLKHISKNIDMQLQEIDREIVSLINEPEMRVFMYESYEGNSQYYVSMYKLLQKIHELKFSNPNIHSIYLYSSKNNKILTDTMSSKADEFYDTDWLDAFSNLKEYYTWMDTRRVTEKVSNTIENKDLITLVRPYPIASHPQNRGGAVIVNVSENTFSSLVNGSQNQRLGKIFVVGRGGSILSHDNKDLLYEPLDEKEWGISILSNDEEGQTDGKMEGINSSFFFITSSYTGWKYVSVVSHTEINEPIIMIRNILFLFAIAMFIVAVIMVIAASRWTYRPVLRFMHSINRTIEESQIVKKGVESLSTFEELEQVFSSVITDYDRARKQVEESIPAIKSKIVSDILMGYLTNYQEVARHLKLVNVSLNPANFVVMVIELDDWPNLQKSLEPDKIHYYIRQISHVAEGVINENSKGASVLNEERVVVLLSFESDNSMFGMDSSIELAHNIKNLVQEELGITVSIGIGSFYKGMSDVKKSFHEAREALKYKILMGCNSVICIDDIRLYNERELYGIFSSVNSIALAVKTADAEEVCTRIDRLFDEVIQKNLPPDFIRQLSMQLAIEGIQAALDAGLEVEDIAEGNSSNVYQTLKCYETVDQMKKYIEELFIGFTEHIRDRRSRNSNNELVDKVLEYIRQHYMDSDLSLNMLAEIFHISVPYLSKIFKEFGETNFMDFLIKIRIEKAMELLDGTGKKINEIAQEVGYTNAHSFIRVFKKYVGMTPGEFRNNKVLKRIDNKELDNKEVTSL